MKKMIKVSTGDLKHVVDSLELMMKKQISEHQYKLNALKIRQVRAHPITIFEWVVEFGNPEELDIVLEHWQKLKDGGYLKYAMVLLSRQWAYRVLIPVSGSRLVQGPFRYQKLIKGGDISSRKSQGRY